MKRVLFVTVGTTAITAQDLWRNIPHDVNLKRDIARFDGASDAAKEQISTPLKPRLIDAHRAFWQRMHAAAPRPEHYYSTSAELVTTLGLLGSREDAVADLFRRNKCDDTLVLLASNTPEGELAAWVNAEVLHNRLFGDVCACAGVVRNCSRLVVEVVRGMELATGFGTLLNGLFEKVRTHEGAQAAFNITGGYKGVIPYITWLASGMFAGAPMYYQHEKMTAFTRIVFRQPGASPGSVQALGGVPNPEENFVIPFYR
jgi:putative CRISPR-associated protein (TIGR02619 family)